MKGSWKSAHNREHYEQLIRYYSNIIMQKQARIVRWEARLPGASLRAAEVLRSWIANAERDIRVAQTRIAACEEKLRCDRDGVG
jgi:hypothetical protein